ncbi:MAG: hypothetical protein U0169_05460 [Polyangiaceae bacterium]
MSTTFEPEVDPADKAWTAPKFMGLLVVTLAVSIALIYAAATACMG